MSPLVLMLILVSLATFVAGQLLLKRAMDSTVRRGFRQRTFAFFILTGTGAMAVSYFLNLGLLQQLDLSYLYPFQGLTLIFISAAAALLLREKLTPPLIVGSLLITVGVVLVSLS
ncbi:MAG: EamA family transporter [Chthoniobacterales bacterium]|nr:EamA family transporter [Chthoniobacterales bacterium]MDQ3119633.1 EamA family transporter [Verrucomicrobiota bacterium]